MNWAGLTILLLGFAVIGLCITVACLWEVAEHRREERDDARDQLRSAGHTIAIAELDAQHRAATADLDTQRLPAWQEFLNPLAAHDRAVTDAMEQQFQDGAS